MDTLSTVIQVLQIILLVYFGGTAIYLFIFGMAGALRRNGQRKDSSGYRDFTIIIPAFMEDPVIVDVISSALEQDYPKDKFRIILIADSFQEETLLQLRTLDLKVVRVSFDISTKAKSLQVALEHLPPSTDLVLMLDADNIMEDYFLQKVNAAAEHTYPIIQCHRIAKNINNSFALLDAISEEVNNNIFRNGHRALGMSSALIGSAMVFDAGMYRKYIPRLNAVGGFDKELELMILHDKVKIDYLNDAFVLDEKVQSAKVFYKQRKRWIYSQFYFFGRDFLSSAYHLIKDGNLDYFDKTLQFSMPPRIMLLGVVLLATLTNLIAGQEPFLYIWTAILAITATMLIVSTPGKYRNFRTLKALFALPGIFLLMVMILLKIKGSNKEFLHTQHNYNTSGKT